MTSPTQSSPAILPHMRQSIQTGGLIMLAQTPAVTAFNRISVVSCYHDLPMREAARRIFRGTIDSATHPSTTHFLKGVSGHLVKEGARLVFKAPGIVFKPQLDNYFKHTPRGKLKSDLIFSGGLSLAEVIINPADTVRTMWQANKKIKQVEKGKLLSHLYKGASANGLRQFGIWLGFPASERLWSKALEDTTPLDPHSISGIVVKSIPQSFQITVPVWFFERLKNELQYHPRLNETGKKTSRYVSAFRHVIHNQGWRGIFRGLTPKVWSNAVLVMGADYLLERGRQSSKTKKN